MKYSEAVMVSVNSGSWVLKVVGSCGTRMGKTEDGQKKEVFDPRCCGSMI